MENPILERLEAWSKSRGISSHLPDQEGFIANITMELGEFLDKPKYETEFDDIDAVADIFVFSATEVFKTKKDFPTSISSLLIGSIVFSDWYRSMSVDEDSTSNRFNIVILKQLNLYSESNSGGSSSAVGHITSIMSLTLHKMLTMGFNPLIVLDEVLKVVESRVGKWDNVSNKFQKDKSPKAQAKWYKPNYKKALLL